MARVTDLYGPRAYASDAMSRYYYAQYARQAQSRTMPPPTGVTQLPVAVLKAYAELWLRPGAPEAVVRAAYRSLAAASHPDAGGNNEAMVRLNQAYATIEQFHSLAEQR